MLLRRLAVNDRQLEKQAMAKMSKHESRLTRKARNPNDE
jgi:hypothetical protein